MRLASAARSPASTKQGLARRVSGLFVRIGIVVAKMPSAYRSRDSTQPPPRIVPWNSVHPFASVGNAAVKYPQPQIPFPGRKAAAAVIPAAARGEPALRRRRAGGSRSQTQPRSFIASATRATATR